MNKLAIVAAVGLACGAAAYGIGKTLEDMSQGVVRHNEVCRTLKPYFGMNVEYVSSGMRYDEIEKNYLAIILKEEERGDKADRIYIKGWEKELMDSRQEVFDRQASSDMRESRDFPYQAVYMDVRNKMRMRHAEFPKFAEPEYAPYSLKPIYDPLQQFAQQQAVDMGYQICMDRVNGPSKSLMKSVTIDASKQ